MPTIPKTALSKERTKRKRAEIDLDVASTDKISTPKPPKKLRKDSAGTSTHATGQKSKEPKVVKIGEVTEIGTSGKVKEGKAKKRSKPKAKATTELESAVADGQTTQKVKDMRRDADAAAPDALAEEDEGASEASDAEDEEEEEIRLQGFSSESDSSDEDFDVKDAPPIDVSKLPSFSKDDAVVQHKLEKARKNPTEEKGVLYLGRIPHGFYEDQMRTYFSQFGDVTRLRLSRNKKTGRSKHYAFIEFGSAAVADIVSETMNNYLLLGHILQCKVIPKDQVHPELWVGANKKWRFIPRDRVARVKQNQPRTREQQRRAEAKLIARQKKTQAKILASGIEYDFQDVAYFN